MRAAVIGCGRMGAFTSENVLNFAPKCWLPLSHAEAITAHQNLKLAALCDSNLNVLEVAAKKYSVNSTYLNANDMFANEVLNLLCISTRTLGRSNLICDASAFGIRAMHVEKPLCNTYDEYEKLKALFSNEKLFITWGAIRRFLPAYKKAVKMANSGAYGELREIRVNQGSAQLFWTHPHSLDLILFAAGERKIQSIQGSLLCNQTEHRPVKLDEDPILSFSVIQFSDGVNGIISQAQGMDLMLTCKDAEIIVASDGREIRIRAPEGGNVYPVDNPFALDDLDEPTGTLAPITHLVNCLQGNHYEIQKNMIIKKDILLTQWLMFAIAESHANSGARVYPNKSFSGMQIWAKTNGKFA
jgi:scyllo-inositol 2-dehydrogenase (NAD+)